MIKIGCLVIIIAIIIIQGASAYSVVGNKIFDPNGQQVLIRGIVRPSFEWNKQGQYANQNDYRLMIQVWGANVIRICLNQDWYLSDETYVATIDQQVQWVRGYGAGVILDLHWNDGNSQKNMADRNSITFWTKIANKYKNNPWILFELYNEPHDVSEYVWKNGDGYYAGMQEMYNAVRATGSDNLVIICGLRWAFDLSHVISGAYAITGTNIAYASHPYDFDDKQKPTWPAAFGNLAASYPIILTEFGQYCKHQGTYVRDLFAYADSLGLHWTAWAWWAQNCDFPSIIKDWNGTPSDDPVGKLVRDSLNGTVTPVVTTAPVVITPATSPKAIYTEGLSSVFDDWSWASSYSLTDTTRAKTGSNSIKLTLKSYGGVYFHYKASSSYFVLGSYSSLSFYVYATSTISKNNIGVNVYGEASTFPSVGEAVATVDATGGQWTLVTIPVSAFGSGSVRISGVAINSKSDASVGDVWIDDIYFNAPASATSTSSTTAKPTTTTSSTTAKPTTTTTTTSSTTAKPTTTTTTTAKPTTSTTSSTASTSTSSTTAKPTTSTTAAAAATSTTSSTSTSTTGSGSCGASNIVFTQTLSNSWVAGSDTIKQYEVKVTSTCTSKTLKALTATATNWNKVGSWSIDVTESSPFILTFPTHLSVSSTGSYSFGYQNKNVQATFTVSTFNFQ